MELPEHLRTGPMAEAAARALQDAQSMAASSNSVPRISLRGREFRLVENGEEVAKFRDYLDVIIVGVEPEAGRMIKTWYSKGYTSGAKEPPTCMSEDGVRPAPWVQDKQSVTCASCPKNTFGSATSPSGKATKACRDGKRIWLKLAAGNLVNGKPFEECVKPFAERTLYGLNITVASLKSFSDHGRKLASLGQGPAVCVTRMTMADAEYPQVEFDIHAWLDADTAPQSLKLQMERPWRIQYASAGLALAGAEEGSTRQALPSNLPGQVPAHLQTQAFAQQPVAQQPAQQSRPAGDIDDAVGKW